LRDFVTAEQSPSIPDLIARSLRHPVKERLVFQREGGAPVPAHISANVLNQADGVSVCIVATDLTELETSTEMLQELRRQKDALLESESRLRAVFAVSPDAIVITDDDGRYVEANPAAGALLGFAQKDQVIGRRLSEFTEPEYDIEQMWADFKREGCFEGEIRIVRSDSTWSLVKVFAVANIRPARHLAVLRDITGRRQAEEALRTAHDQLEDKVKERTAELATAVSDLRVEIVRRQEAEAGLRRTNQILQMLSDCNEAIVRIDDQQQLMQELCRIIVEVGGYPFAWVGLAENDKYKTFRPVAYAGFEAGYLESARVSWADTERGRGPTGTAIRTRVIQFGRDFLNDASLAPWRESAIRQGFRSSIALPLNEANTVLGALTIYAEAEDAFAESQVKILTELADDLSFGLAALRTRAALRASRDLLRVLAGELTLTEQRERQRMAKILHDHIQQLLVGAKYRVSALARAGDDVVRKGTQEVEELLNECISTSRTLTAELSPPILQEGGLAASLEWLAEWMGDKHGLSVELTIEEEISPVLQDVKVLLFESTRELLFNVVKHAQVKAATVSLRRVNGDGLEVSVSDQGIGFDPERVGRDRARGSGFGLFSIRERMDLMGGQLEIMTKQGEGSRFRLIVPLAASLASRG